jgi:hypothetical protein
MSPGGGFLTHDIGKGMERKPTGLEVVRHFTFPGGVGSGKSQNDFQRGFILEA